MMNLPAELGCVFPTLHDGEGNQRILEDVYCGLGYSLTRFLYGGKLDMVIGAISITKSLGTQSSSCIGEY